jgi:hypothetical protein
MAQSIELLAATVYGSTCGIDSASNPTMELYSLEV